MLNFTISHVWRCCHVQSHTQRTYTSIGFVAAGLRHYRLTAPNGRLLEELWSPGASLSLGVSNNLAEFDFGPDRENWGISTPDLPISNAENSSQVELTDRSGQKIILPRRTWLSESEVSEVRLIYRRLLAAHKSPTPLNGVRMFADAMTLLSLILTKAEQAEPDYSPASSLKNLIETDLTFRRPLTEMSSAVGYAKDHLRTLFAKKYGLTPKDYRRQYRLRIVNNLIRDSGLTIKEISEGTGFENPSHLCATYRKEFGITPGEAVRRFRHFFGLSYKT